ncbi:DNA-binding PadR family transcriptional regulator [Anoxybacillus mongoliensis]|uniref:DNA-binding PadR family transcriptional regulator n=1 Tax=Anoxybacillus mongoliensis TaxID=452565 RepID=A0A7W8N8U2_9BACL|nr:helix-turn-helix transcriptional regulator [Anoxybacillus mongoliensis]MBB5355873.1 DNA-binding PadR family transcriptional regulator [Anoxybacillus mongoliensis]MCX8001914.1 PadR family transcriptional regulator [Anoxybacillus mongoliensis]
MSVKLVILGLLMEGEKHPYEIQQIVNERHMKHYIKLAAGSLYYAFEQLEKQGYVEVVDVVRDSNRPDKTIYRITEKGKQHFEQLLLEQLQKHEHIHRSIYAGLSFAAYADEEKVSAVLKQRLHETKQQLEKLKLIFEQKRPNEYVTKLYVLKGVIMHLETEIEWLEQLINIANNKKLKEKGGSL